MITSTYKDFTELFYKLNKFIIEAIELYEDGNTGTNYYLKPMLLKSYSYNCDLNLGDFNYSSLKIKNLVNNYIDLDELREFKKNLNKHSSTSITFYFKTKKPKKGTTTDNGPCLLNIVLTRKSRGSKWTRCFINYRTTEINRRFGADLILFNKFIEELPSCCEISEIYIYLPKSYLNIRYSTTQHDMSKLTGESELQRKMLKEYKSMSDSNKKHSSYKSKHKIERILRGEEKYQKIDISNFKILEEEQ